MGVIYVKNWGRKTGEREVEYEEHPLIDLTRCEDVLDLFEDYVAVTEQLQVVLRKMHDINARFLDMQEKFNDSI